MLGDLQIAVGLHRDLVIERTVAHGGIVIAEHDDERGEQGRNRRDHRRGRGGTECMLPGHCHPLSAGATPPAPATHFEKLTCGTWRDCSSASKYWAWVKWNSPAMMLDGTVSMAVLNLSTTSL